MRIRGVDARIFDANISVRFQAPPPLYMLVPNFLRTAEVFKVTVPLFCATKNPPRTIGRLVTRAHIQPRPRTRLRALSGIIRRPSRTTGQENDGAAAMHHCYCQPTAIRLILMRALSHIPPLPPLSRAPFPLVPYSSPFPRYLSSLARRVFC